MKPKVYFLGLNQGFSWLIRLVFALGLCGAVTGQNTANFPTMPGWNLALTSGDVYEKNLTELMIEIHYPAGVDKNSLDDKDIWVVSQNGFNQLATFKEVTPTTTEPSTGGMPHHLDTSFEVPIQLNAYRAVYSLSAPEGEVWKESDNERYTVLLEPNQVRYASGAFIQPDYLGAFQIRIGEPKPVQPLETHVDVQSNEDQYLATVTLVFPSSGFTVTDWGRAERSGDTFQIHLSLSGPPQDTFDLPVVTEVSHRYELGSLDPGPYQIFVQTEERKLAWQEFHVEPMNPPVPTDVELKVETYDNGTASLKAVIHFLDPYFVLAEPGEPRLDGHTYYINAKAQRVVFVRAPDEPAITEVKYLLNPPEKGEYLVVFSLNNEPVARTQFNIENSHELAPVRTELISKPVTERGGEYHDFQVYYQSETPINLDSLGGEAIGVQSWVIAARFMGDIPLWAYQNAKLMGVEPEADNTKVTATYRIQAPDRGWQPDMNGWLQVALNERTVKTIDGLYVKPDMLGEIMIEIEGLPAKAEVSVEYEDSFIYGDVRFESYDFPYMSVIDWGKPHEDGPVIYLDAKAHEVLFFMEPDEPLVEEHRYLVSERKLVIFQVS